MSSSVTTPDTPEDAAPGVRARATSRLRSKPARRHNPLVDGEGHLRVSPALASGLEGLATLGRLVVGAMVPALMLGTLAGLVALLYGLAGWSAPEHIDLVGLVILSGIGAAAFLRFVRWHAERELVQDRGVVRVAQREGRRAGRDAAHPRRHRRGRRRRAPPQSSTFSISRTAEAIEGHAARAQQLHVLDGQALVPSRGHVVPRRGRARADGASRPRTGKGRTHMRAESEHAAAKSSRRRSVHRTRQ